MKNKGNSKRSSRINKASKYNPSLGFSHGHRGSNRTWAAIVIVLYLTFIILSMIAFSADRTVESKMQETYEYHLIYRTDGRQTHYYIERVDTSKAGTIDLVYTTATNSLVVDVKNIKVLYIFCRSMYEDECKKVYGFDPVDNSNYYKWYFIEKNHLNVNIDSEYKLDELKFIDTPLAYKVIVDGITWTEGKEYFYINDYGNALSNVPKGHTNVDLYFKPSTGKPPVAVLSASKTVVPINYTITFDATESYDPDGTITRYILDFGDGKFDSLNLTSHYYSKPGVYGVLLTVRDNDLLVDHAFVNITVVPGRDVPEILGVVPNQERPEDSPPWVLNLTNYEPIPSSKKIKFYWYLTGENKSLYTLSGENGSDDRFIFTPKPNAFGTDLVKIWLKSTENISVHQVLWINITPVNDPPTISNLPDLIVHYDDPYTFDYESYVNDLETPRGELILTIYDGYEKNYITLSGLTATYNYPHELVGEVIYATVIVSDGEATAQDLICIQVTSDHVPKLTKYLPDVLLYEGTIKYNVFDLDDYFMDPDQDSIFFSYGQTHVEISIKTDHTVDISASSEWTGAELVTFRARDPVGALAEDSILVTVLPVNDPPTISGVPDFYIRYEQDYRFDLTPYIHDNDNDTEELMIIPSDPEHIRLDIQNNLVIIMNYPFEYLGMTEQVRLTVFDGIDSAFQVVRVTVTENYPPELLSPLPDIVFLEDIPLRNAFNLDNFFLDVDGDVLYYIAGNKYINITINTDHSVDLSAPHNWFGNEQVYFRATDPTGALQQDLIMVTVLPVNDAPVLRPIPVQYGNESTRWVLELEPYMFDVDNNISELKITVDSDYVVVSGSSLIFLGAPELGKEVRVTVSDGEFSSSQAVEVYLKMAKRPRMLTLWDLLMSILPFVIIIILIIVVIAGIVYRKKSRFTAEEVFLIHSGGTLITHLTRNQQANVDDIIFSGMFTAVQEFIRDTFTGDRSNSAVSDADWALDELKLGENKILIERSENTYLAVIFSGEGSKRLRRIVKKLLDKIETKYDRILPNWDGNINLLAGTKQILSVLIKSIDDEHSDSKSVSTNKTIESAQDSGPGVDLFSLLASGPAPDAAGADRGHTKVTPVTTTVLPRAKPRVASETRELLECMRSQAGADKPGLTAWPIKKSKKRSEGIRITTVSGSEGGQKIRTEMPSLPMAYGIIPKKSRTKMIAIKKSKPHAQVPAPAPAPAPERHEKRKYPVSEDLISDTPRSTEIAFKSTDKSFHLDTNRSLFKQLGELNKKKEG
jgi:PKD repeat protein